jgi:3-oxoacyl-[acyl-carrier protein] reductase
MDLKLNDKTALVFGGSRGLGRAIAAELAAEGAKVVIVARDSARVERVAAELGVLGLAGDVSKPGASRALVLQAAELLGRGPDLLVTNTGGPAPGNFEAISDDAWRTGFDNLWMSFVESVGAALPAMKEKGFGRILAVTSVAAREPQPGLVVSNGLRAGLLGLVNAISRDVASSGVTVNALLPGYTNTDRMKEVGVTSESMGSKIPAGRIGEPHEFAALAAFLASERASYITGQAIAVDGGLLQSI